MLVILAALALTLEPEVGGAKTLTIEVFAEPSRIVAGESAKLSVRWSTTAPVGVRFASAVVLLDSGRGLEPWHEQRLVIGTGITGRDTLQPGRAVVTEEVIGVGVQGVSRRRDVGLAFPAEGTYRLAVLWRQGDAKVLSNVVTVVARAPRGTDAQLLQVLRRDPEILLARPTSLQKPGVIEGLVARHPGSRLLARPLVAHLEILLYRAIGDAPEPPSPSAPIQGDVPALLARLKSTDLRGTPFDADRLLLLAHMSGRAGRPEMARAAFRELAGRYPETRAGREAARSAPD